MDARDVAGVLLRGGVLEFNVKRPFTYVSGLKGPIYIDCRLLLSDVPARKIIVTALVDVLQPLKYDLVAATATGGIPWGAWAAEAVGKPFVYVRGAAKDHGKGNMVEGRVSAGSVAVVVEDLVNRGGSSINTVSGLRGAGALVKECVTIFDYKTAEAHNVFKKAGVKLYSLTDFNTAVEVAEAGGYLDAAEAEEARKWAKDPGRWCQ